MKWIGFISPLIRWQTTVGTKCLCQRSFSSMHYFKHLGPPSENATFPNNFNNLYGTKFVDVPLASMTVRHYAKGKDKKKEKEETSKTLMHPILLNYLTGKHKTSVDERMLAEVIPLDDIKNQMQKAVDQLKAEYIQSLSLRSSTGAIDNLHVSFEGKEYSLQELGQVVRKDTKTVIINMVAFPQAITAVLKALQKSGMNLNPQQDGTTLYIPVPRVTTEHRAQLAKNAKTLFIQCRDAVKNVQLKHEKKLKNSSLAQDTVFSVQQQLGALAESYITQADSLHQIKVKELSGKDS
ncbi:Putative mitochondrion [Gryllus bimaculatus]|nr:Putative mitochondrion [Gryllus bimaculatus]